MAGVLRWLVAMLFRRFRWVALGAVLRALTQRTRQRSVDEATDELAERLPDPVVKALDSAPGDLLRAGGSAMVAGRMARSAGSRSRRVGSTVKRIRDQWSNPGQAVQAARDQWRYESALAERELWADYHRAQGDHAAADEALLDRRRHVERPLPPIPDPVPAGRTRARRRVDTTVDRVQRTYRRRSRPWDR